MKLEEALRSLEALLTRRGVRALLVFLNGLTAHRFTALFRFDGETLNNAYFYDRDDPRADSCPDIPVSASYCVYVRDTRSTFVTNDSLDDARVRDHPKRNEVRAYCGVPLVDEDGIVFGSICHFDFRPVSISQANVELMEAVAPLLKRLERRPQALARAEA